MSRKSSLPLWFGIGLGAAAGWYVAQQNWAMRYLSRQDIRQTLATSQNQFSDGLTFESQKETPTCTIRHMIEDGIQCH